MVNENVGGNPMYEVQNTVHNSDQNSASDFAELIVREADNIKPLFKELFLRRYVMGEGEYEDIFKAYCKTAEVDYTSPVRMLIIKPEGERREEELHFLKKRIETVLGSKGTLAEAALNGHILVITDILEKNRILSLLERIRVAVRKHSGADMAAVYSDVLTISGAPERYGRLKVCLDNLFYADNSKILYENDAHEGHSLGEQPDYAVFENYIKNGDATEAKSFLNDFFGVTEKIKPAPRVSKEYCTGLYICVMRCCGQDKIEGYLGGIGEIRSAQSFGTIKRLLHEVTDEVAQANKPKNTRIYSSLIKDTIETIDKNIENENLSLRWLAGTILYTNVDYLGKLFKKETGKNFSHYVMEKRMEMAKELILEGKKDRIYEVAEKVGYGSNSQYFSQVFKKYTGVSPLEYKEFAKMARQKAKE